jgi:hypothetical protein
MSSASVVRSIESALLRTKDDAGQAPRLFQGIVTSISKADVTVALGNGREVSATFALALPYAACEGDLLLLIGDQAGYFVIGVVSGQGKTSLEMQGNVSLRAVGGQLDLTGDEGVRVRGPSVEVHADKLRTVARSVVEMFQTFHQHVAELLHVQAGQQVSIVDEGSYQQAKTTAIQTEETVTINGKEIHLG